MGISIMSIAVLIGPPINGEFVTKYQSFHQVSYFSGAITTTGALGIILAKYYSGKGIFAIN